MMRSGEILVSHIFLVRSLDLRLWINTYTGLRCNIYKVKGVDILILLLSSMEFLNDTPNLLLGIRRKPSDVSFVLHGLFTIDNNNNFRG